MGYNNADIVLFDREGNLYEKNSMMKKLLFIGHQYHQKTQSHHFLLDWLKEYYIVECFYVDPYSDELTDYTKIREKTVDVCLCWQEFPDLRNLKQHISFKHGVFFPMYDGAPPSSSYLWTNVKDFTIISFCKALHDMLTEMGLSSYYIQYFPEPKNAVLPRDEKSVFFWQRTNHITMQTLEVVLQDSEIRRVYLHNALDPCHHFCPPSGGWVERTIISTWFEEKEDLFATMNQCALYFAPRMREGIGMSFLEAMARGHCVIAPDVPTMNEYISHGHTGFLYSDKHIPLKLGDIRQVQENTLDYIAHGYREWLSKRELMLEWFIAPSKLNEKRLLSIAVDGSPPVVIFSLFDVPIITVKRKLQESRVFFLGVRLYKYASHS